MPLFWYIFNCKDEDVLRVVMIYTCAFVSAPEKILLNFWKLFFADQLKFSCPRFR